jgi:hypothetical protein
MQPDYEDYRAQQLRDGQVFHDFVVDLAWDRGISVLLPTTIEESAAPAGRGGIVEVAVSDVVIGKRHRTDMGDLNALSASIKAIGLLHPIVIGPDNKLIVGQRRVQAYTPRRCCAGCDHCAAQPAPAPR